MNISHAAHLALTDWISPWGSCPSSRQVQVVLGHSLHCLLSHSSTPHHVLLQFDPYGLNVAVYCCLVVLVHMCVYGEFYYVFLGAILVFSRTLERQRHKHYWLQTQQDGREGNHLNRTFIQFLCYKLLTWVCEKTKILKKCLKMSKMSLYVSLNRPKVIKKVWQNIKDLLSKICGFSHICLFGFQYLKYLFIQYYMFWNFSNK